jgi:hypothetical protein
MTSINPEKMTKAVRLLWEIAEVHDLSLRVLAEAVGVSHQAIKFWFEGNVPTPQNEKMILAACAKLEAAYPDPVMETLPSGAQVSAASWGNPELDDEDPAIAADRAFGARLRVMFNMLQDKLSDSEKRILAVSWVGFSEVVSLAEKNGITIPKR